MHAWGLLEPMRLHAGCCSAVQCVTLRLDCVHAIHPNAPCRRLWSACMERCDDATWSELEPEAVVALLAPLAQAGKAWLSVSRPAAAEWPFQQLRERLMFLEALGADECQPGDVRCVVQLLQFHTLQGSIILAGNAGHQALWSNLVARMQRLMDACLLAPNHTALLCKELADTLAAQAEAAAAATTTTAGTAGRSPVQLLQCAEGLVAQSVQLSEQLLIAGLDEDGANTAGQEGGETAAAERLQQLRGALVEVRLRKAEALLAEGSLADARGAAEDVLRHLLANLSDGTAASTTRAMKLLVSTLLALGQQTEAATQVKELLGAGCLDVQDAAEVLSAFAAGCSLRRQEGVEQLCEVAAAAARAYPGRHQPTMAVMERLLGQAYASTSPSPADGVALRVLADGDAADAIKNVRIWVGGLCNPLSWLLSCSATSHTISNRAHPHPHPHPGTRSARPLPQHALPPRPHPPLPPARSPRARPPGIGALLQPSRRGARPHRAPAGRVLRGDGGPACRPGVPVARQAGFHRDCGLRCWEAPGAAGAAHPVEAAEAAAGGRRRGKAGEGDGSTT